MNDTHDALPLLAQRFMSLAKGTLVTVHQAPRYTGRQLKSLTFA